MKPEVLFIPLRLAHLMFEEGNCQNDRDNHHNNSPRNTLEFGVDRQQFAFMSSA
jgi:hypothetical protein